MLRQIQNLEKKIKMFITLELLYYSPTRQTSLLRMAHRPITRMENVP